MSGCPRTSMNRPSCLHNFLCGFVMGCGRHRSLVVVTIVVFGWITCEVRNIGFGSEEGFTTTTTSTNPEIDLVIPNKPDASIRQNLNTIIPVDAVWSPLRNCEPTAQVQISTSEDTKKWVLQTFNDKGARKRMGGDEFYITFTESNGNAEKENFPSAVALISDLQDGSYKLDFVAPPLMSRRSSSPNYVNRGGHITVHFQYTCGIGFMAPPTKDLWLNGGSLQKSFQLFTPDSPYIRPFQPASLHKGTLSQYDKVLVFGDSAMRQFVKNASRSFESNTVFRVKKRKPWTTNLIEEHLNALRKQFGRDLGAAAAKPLHGTALMLGSSIWDILASRQEGTPSRRQSTSSSSSSSSSGISPNTNTVFLDHLDACQYFIKTVRQDYPMVDVVWKSPTAMHIHVVDPSNPVNAVKNNVASGTNNTQAISQRVRYMSTSRMAHLYKLQEELMLALQVPFLDVYNATYLSAAWTFPGDGRHYKPELHKEMLGWFY